MENERPTGKVWILFYLFILCSGHKRGYCLCVLGNRSWSPDLHEWNTTILCLVLPCFQVFPAKEKTFLASKLKFTAHWRSPGEKKGNALKFKRTSLERQRGGEENKAGGGVCPSETWLKSFYILVKYWTLLWKSKKYGLSSNNNDHHSDNNNNSMCSVLWEKLFTHSGQTVELHPTGTKILDLFWSQFEILVI